MEPLLFDAFESNRPGERAAALRAFAEVGGREVILPGSLMGQVLAALMDDDKLIVVRAAIRALRRVNVPAERKLDVIHRLLAFARAYGPERLYDRDVESALRHILHLSYGELYEERAAGLVIEIIDGFPSCESSQLLNRLPLEHHAGWPAVAVRALRVDPHPSYYGIHDGERQRLLRKLAEIATTTGPSWLEELEKVGLERLPHGHVWVWAIADVLAYHHQHDRAAVVCEAVVDALPDSREKRPVRRLARQIALGHQLDWAATKGDSEALERVLQELEQLAGETED